MTKRLMIVTNIPSPYRVHALNALYVELSKRDIQLDVRFMASSESGRYWQINTDAWKFKGEILPGLHFPLGRINFHVNPGVWLAVLRDAPTWLLIGGGWHLPTSIGLIGLLPLYRRKTRALFWGEINHLSSRHLSGRIAAFRRLLLNRVEGIVTVSDKIARQTLTEYWGLNNPHIIDWPNLVDETIYHDEIAKLREKSDALRQKFGIPLDQRVLFWSARLIEEAKGISNFLQAVEPIFPPNVTILIAGDGQDRDKIQAWLNAHPTAQVRLLGHLAQSDLIEYMAVADAAMLPSFRDPTPLSLIEALWAKLPLLASQNCGNWPETLIPSENGWLVDPADADNLRQAFQAFLDSSDTQLEQMGKRSLEIAQSRFSTPAATTHFVDQLLTQFPPK